MTKFIVLLMLLSLNVVANEINDDYSDISDTATIVAQADDEEAGESEEIVAEPESESDYSEE